MPADTYEIFRLVLAVRRPDDLFTPFIEDRQAFIENRFVGKIEFDHYGTEFSFVRLSTDVFTGAIVGKVGRSFLSHEHAPPEEDFDEQVRTAWRALVVIIDPNPGTEGQKIAVQVDRKVGKPHSILRSFLKHINSDLTAPYHLEAVPLTNTDSLWDFEKRNRGEIVSITFDFIVPNGVWTTDSSLKEELRDANESLNAQRVITTLKSDTGIRTDSPQIATALAYTGSGNGEVSAKSSDGEKFSSTSNKKTASLPYDVLYSPKTALVMALVGLAKILGYE